MKSPSTTIVLSLSYLTYLLFGMFAAGIGPVLGELAERTTSPIAAVGGVLTFVFLASVIAQVIAGPLTDRHGYKPVLVVCLVVLAAGILGMTNAVKLPVMFLFALLGGLGQGGVDMGANLVVADAAPGRTTSALNVLHFFFGAGAFVGPALIGVAIALTGSGLPVHWLVAGCFLVLAATMVLVLPGSPNRSGMAPARRYAGPGSAVYLSPLLWLLGILMFVYVGVEFGLGSWISTYMKVSAGAIPQVGAWITSAYWAALAIGRLAGAAASPRLTRIRLLSLALGASLLGGLGLIASHGALLPTVLCLVWIAFSYGTVYPTTVALTAAAFADDRGKAVSALVAMGSIGAATLPWAAGLLLRENAGAAYPWSVALGLAVLLILLVGIQRGLQRTSIASGG